jgi:hypothetical protein
MLDWPAGEDAFSMSSAAWLPDVVEGSIAGHRAATL